MKVKLTEQQFRRVILKEQWMSGITFFGSDPIEELNIVQPGKDIIEKGLVYIGKAIGIVDIIVTQGFKQVENDIEELVREGKINLDKPLKKLMIGTHGTRWGAGCGQFVFDVDDDADASSYRFLAFLSKFVNSSTKVFFTGCYSGSDPTFLNRMAHALGVEKITAATGNYAPALNTVFGGSFITCKAITQPESPHKGKTTDLWDVDTHSQYSIWTDEEKKYMVNILKRTKGKGLGEVKKYKKERLKEKLKTMGCTLSSSNPYGSWI